MTPNGSILGSERSEALSLTQNKERKTDSHVRAALRLTDAESRGASEVLLLNGGSQRKRHEESLIAAHNGE